MTQRSPRAENTRPRCACGAGCTDGVCDAQEQAGGPFSLENWDCEKFGHRDRHDGPHLCEKCGEHIGSVLSTEPYDYGAARRELEAVHQFLRDEAGIDQSVGDGEWGVVEGYYEPEWTEWGGTVEALRKLMRQEGFGGYCAARGPLEAVLHGLIEAVDHDEPDVAKVSEAIDAACKELGVERAT